MGDRLRPDLASLSVVHREPGGGVRRLAARRVARGAGARRRAGSGRPSRDALGSRGRPGGGGRRRRRWSRGTPRPRASRPERRAAHAGCRGTRRGALRPRLAEQVTRRGRPGDHHTSRRAGRLRAGSCRGRVLRERGDTSSVRRGGGGHGRGGPAGRCPARHRARTVCCAPGRSGSRAGRCWWASGARRADGARGCRPATPRWRRWSAGATASYALSFLDGDGGCAVGLPPAVRAAPSAPRHRAVPYPPRVSVRCRFGDSRTGGLARITERTPQ